MRYENQERKGESMTEFETASLALQNTSVAAQHAAMAQAFWLGVGQIFAVIGGTIVNAFLILRGFRLMHAGTEQRRVEADQRHAESMAALRAMIHGLETVIERTAPPKS